MAAAFAVCGVVTTAGVAANLPRVSCSQSSSSAVVRSANVSFARSPLSSTVLAHHKPLRSSVHGSAARLSGERVAAGAARAQRMRRAVRVEAAEGGDAVELVVTEPKTSAGDKNPGSESRGKGAGGNKRTGGKGAGGAGGNKPDSESRNQKARAELQTALDTGKEVTGKVEVVNRGGLILRILNGRYRAFMPLSQMRASRITSKVGGAGEGTDVAKALGGEVGKLIDVRVMEVDKKRVLVSERAALQAKGCRVLKAGAQVSGLVTSLSDFGAFVELDVKGAEGCEGLTHISELSWNRISHPRDVVAVGDKLDLKVLEVTPETRRITLSLKQMQADPLLETLDTIMPVTMPEPSIDEDEEIERVLPGLLDICQSLLAEEGIEAVIPGRQAVEQRVVSQDLELWLTNEMVVDGYNLLARAGRQVQEIHVVTTLDRDSIKRAIKKATSSLK